MPATGFYERNLLPDGKTKQPDDAFKPLRQYPDTHMVATPVSKRHSFSSGRSEASNA
jgi:hypothetical protein